MVYCLFIIVTDDAFLVAVAIADSAPAGTLTLGPPEPGRHTTTHPPLAFCTHILDIYYIVQARSGHEPFLVPPDTL
jgi:hypothetical protein